LIGGVAEKKLRFLLTERFLKTILTSYRLSPSRNPRKERTMARPRTFDEDQVLDAAMTTFWDKGYEATSLQDLMAAMNLQKGSIYKAFGDKHQLFMKVLDRYLTDALSKTKGLLNAAQSPRAALRFLIEENLVMISNEDSCGRGCFAVNAAVELAPHDAVVATRLHEHFSGLEATLRDVIERGQAVNEFRSDLDPAQVAKFLVMCFAGMATTVKGPYQRDDARGMIQTLLTLLQ
jgi:TetR/AcrR family transcriptional repressor of nem operon